MPMPAPQVLAEEGGPLIEDWSTRRPGRVNGPGDLNGQLAHAEATGTLSEFDALAFQAVLAMAEGSEFAREYLDMAEAVAGSTYEQATIAEARATYELLRDNPPGRAVHAEQRWRSVVAALCGIDDMATMDVILRALTDRASRGHRQVDERTGCTARRPAGPLTAGLPAARRSHDGKPPPRRQRRRGPAPTTCAARRQARPGDGRSSRTARARRSRRIA
jgi:hypothetical protein